MRRRADGFTLIELLVVIAIIAILSAALMPALSSATDRTRVGECKARLTHLSVALRMYHEDWGAYPPAVAALHTGGYVANDQLLQCTKTGTWFHYARPVAGAPPNTLICACADPATSAGLRPHGYRTRVVVLEKSGKVGER